MIAPLTLALALSFNPVQDEDETPPPSPELIESTVEAIETALEEKDLEAATAAVRAAQAVPDEDVTEILAEVAQKDEAELALAALDVLGRIGHESAVDEFKKIHRKGKKRLGKDEDWALELYRSMGRTGSTDLLEVIGKDSLDKSNLRLDKARILAIGKIRDPKSVETLMSLMNKVRVRDRQPFMDHFRASMAALTGDDAGGSLPLWQAWWNDNKRKLELPEQEPEIEVKKLRVVWEGFWRASSDRKKKGDDDEEEDHGRR